MSSLKSTRKATGPTSASGKERVSKNALRHGLCAGRWLILPQERQEYEEFQEGVIRDLAPDGPMADMLAARAVRAAWRLRKAYHADAALWTEARATADANQAQGSVSQSYSTLELEVGLVRQTMELCEAWLGTIAQLKRSPKKLKGRLLTYANQVVERLEDIREALADVRCLHDLSGGRKLWLGQLPHFGLAMGIYVVHAKTCLEKGEAPTTYLESLAEQARERVSELEEALAKVKEAEELEAAAATPDPQKLALIQRYVTSAERGLDRALKAYREFVSQKEPEGMDSSG